MAALKLDREIDLQSGAMTRGFPVRPLCTVIVDFHCMGIWAYGGMADHTYIIGARGLDSIAQRTIVLLMDLHLSWGNATCLRRLGSHLT